MLRRADVEFSFDLAEPGARLRLGLTGIAVVVLVIGVESSDGGESDLAAIGRVLIGALFIALAVKQWAGRPREGEEPAMPAWMASIEVLGDGIAALG